MNRLITGCVGSLLGVSLAGAASSQVNVQRAGVTVVSDSTDTAGTIVTDNHTSGFNILNGVPQEPYDFSTFVELEEPFRPPFGDPEFHRVSSSGVFESIGDEWAGSAEYSLEYPDSLDIGTNVGDPNTTTGSGLVLLTSVNFSIDQPTLVEFDSMFRTDRFETHAPTSFDGFSASLILDDGSSATMFQTSFDPLASGVDQYFNDSVLLEAGAYEFRTRTLAFAFENAGDRRVSGNFDYTLTFVPTPASAATLLAAGFLFRRSRTG